MLDGILDAAFLQAAGRAGKGGLNPLDQVITFLFDLDESKSNLMRIAKAEFTSDLTITRYLDGVLTVDTVLVKDSGDDITFSVDNGSVVEIRGAITSITFTGPGASNVHELDVSSCNTLRSIFGYFESLTMLKIGDNLGLTEATFGECEKLKTIYYPAINQNVAEALVTAISYAPANGTLYTDANGAYYSTLEAAAQANNWTIVTSNND
ncbi:MAG: hypothetical protein J6Q19_04805 [Bacteroidaceae bacterium]|nr:hypothetical protein [Bacteroidaceae bacterium]